MKLLPLLSKYSSAITLAIFISLLTVMQANAAAVWIEDRRLVSSDGTDGGSSQSPGTLFESWNATGNTSAYDQDSSVSSTGFSATGKATAWVVSSDNDFANGYGTSMFDMTFTLANSAILSVDGSVTGPNNEPFRSKTYFKIYSGDSVDPADVIFSTATDDPSNSLRVIDLDQQLSAGTYRIVARVSPSTADAPTIEQGYREIETFYNVTGTFTAVPVPAAAWLFGSALIGLASIKRKQ